MWKFIVMKTRLLTINAHVTSLKSHQSFFYKCFGEFFCQIVWGRHLVEERSWDTRQRYEPYNDCRWNGDFSKEKPTDCRREPTELSAPECAEAVVETETANREVDDDD